MRTRTLIRIVGKEGLFLKALVPAWNTTKVIRISSLNVPIDIRKEIKVGTRLFGYYNTSAIKDKDLNLEIVELAPELEEDDF